MVSLKIVTGADYTHGRCLMNFIKTVNYFEPEARLIVYDLGLSAEQKVTLRRLLSDRAEVKVFDFSQYPDHFNMERYFAGSYAWKPVIIWKELQESRGRDEIMCWFDAGTLFHQRQKQVREVPRASSFGAYIRSGYYNMTSHTHPKVFEYFLLSSQWGEDKYMPEGGHLSFDPNNDFACELVSEWARLALVKDCIVPEGATKRNHEFDQPLLGILAYQKGMKLGEFVPFQLRRVFRMKRVIRTRRFIIGMARYLAREGEYEVVRQDDARLAVIRYLRRGGSYPEYSIQNKDWRSINRLDLFIFWLFGYFYRKFG